jgi:hypothetical protein
MRAPGPFLAEQLKSKDPYELSEGHAIFTPPTGQRGGKANLEGGKVLGTDPAVTSAGIDAGFSAAPNALRAPDISVGNVEDAPGWAKTAPPLAVEYADVGQDEVGLRQKIRELFEAGTRYVWVVRLAQEPRHVEVHEPNATMKLYRAGETLTAPGVLQNPVLVEAMWDEGAANEAALRNLLNRAGYARSRARSRGRRSARGSALGLGRVRGARLDALRRDQTACARVQRRAEVEGLVAPRDHRGVGRRRARDLLTGPAGEWEAEPEISGSTKSRRPMRRNARASGCCDKPRSGSVDHATRESGAWSAGSLAGSDALDFCVRFRAKRRLASGASSTRSSVASSIKAVASTTRAYSRSASRAAG